MGLGKPMPPRRGAASRWALFAICAVVFVGAGWLTLRQCGSGCCHTRPMAGGWTLSTAWVRKAGESPVGAAASFMGMWVVMMIAMMTPSLAPMLAGYQRSLPVAQGARRV